MKNSKLLLLFLLLGFFACKKNAMIEEMEEMENPTPEPVIDTVDIEFLDLNLSNLPNQIYVNDIAVDNNNVLWLANRGNPDNQFNNAAPLLGYQVDTEEWLVEFPPAEWDISYYTVVSIANGEKIYALSGSSLRNTIVSWKNGEWALIEFDDPIFWMTASPLEDVIWVSTEEGLFRQTGDERQIFNSENSNLPVDKNVNGSFIQYVQVNPDGTVWASQGNRLFFFENETWQEHPNSPTGNSYIITALEKASDNSIFIQNFKESFYEVNKEGIIADLTNTIFDEYNYPLYSNIVRNQDSGNMSIATNSGFYYYQPSIDSTLIVNDENAVFPTNELNSKLEKDLNGQIWIGGDQFLGKLPQEFQ